MPTADRLAMYSQPTENGCIEWTGTRTYDGYGIVGIWVEDVPLSRGAHRVAYAEAHGPIPDGMQVHHRCYNRACINPDHLELKTPRANLLDGDSQAPARLNTLKTHCAQGHPYDEENTAYRPNGWRRCKECYRQRARESAKRNRLIRQSLAIAWRIETGD